MGPLAVGFSLGYRTIDAYYGQIYVKEYISTDKLINMLSLKISRDLDTQRLDFVNCYYKYSNSTVM